MTPDDFYTKYVGKSDVSSSDTPSSTQSTLQPAVRPITYSGDVTNDVVNDVPKEARTVTKPVDYPPAPTRVGTMTPDSFHAKYIMALNTAEGAPGLSPINVTTASMLQQKDKGQYDGLCQRFVEDATYGRHGIFDSAIDAWNRMPNKVQGLQGVKPGDLVYFGPDASNEGDGHVGIYEGSGMFKSATSTGIKDVNIGDWMKQTGQQVLGYVPA